MSKKIISLLICAMLVSGMILSASAAGFPDLSADHWSYANIMELVADGTINGFEDGTFRPSGTVTRAQFVKMIGKGSTPASVEYSDVPRSHWSYEYVKYSGMEVSGSAFRPDEPITRNDVVNLLWKRAGSVETGFSVPSVILSQGTKPSAVAWAYTYGIMIGNDGVNLRLNETLTRAEAAKLIVMGRKVNSASAKNSFVGTVNDDLLKNVFVSLQLVDREYNPSAVLTNKEVARAALRYGNETKALTYKGYDKEGLFEDEFAKDIYMAGHFCLGDENINKAFADSPANFADTIALLSYGAISKTKEAMAFHEKNKFYSDATANTEVENLCLTFAKNYGVFPFYDGTCHAKTQVTMKDFAALLIMFDHVVGMNTSYATNYVKKDVSLDTGKYMTAGLLGNFQAITVGVDQKVYEVPFALAEGKNAAEFYDTARDFSNTFTTMLTALRDDIYSKTGAKLVFVYYPWLAADNGNGVTLRVKCIVESVPGGSMDIKTAFGTHINSGISYTLTDKAEFYADIVTGQPLFDLIMPISKVTLEKIL